MSLLKEEAEIGKRIRLVRKEHGVSRRLAAAQMGISGDQLNRIERGEVAIHFFPAWNFCRFTDINPLWLAFGTGGRLGFHECANNTVPAHARFLEMMSKFGQRYDALLFHTYESWRASGSVFTESGTPVITTRTMEVGRGARLAPKKGVAPLILKRYLMPEMTAEAPPSWSELRSLLVSKTESAESKKELAQRLGVTPAAISQWRSGANAPSADKALRILEFVRETEAKQKQSACSATTRKSKSKRYENYEKTTKLRSKEKEVT